ncbi:MAG TPA: glycosyltransferase family 39 protein [Candidatus Angelobacter sp.]|nr:glycosyltransferase family 39 protein [Candidatus Angelobacter sp.]
MKLVLIRALTSAWLIFLVALGARLGFAWDQERKIPREVLAPASFAQETGSIAYALATGKGFSSPFKKETGPTAWLTPVYPLLVAGIFKVFGIFTRASFFAVVWLNALCSSAVCVAIFFAGKRVAGLGAGSVAAWLWAIFPNAVMVPFEWVWDTSLSALLATVILWATLELAESPRWRDWCAYGLLWGFTLMTNPSLGSLLPFLLGWAAYRARREAKFASLNRALAAAGIAVLCCVPWTVRNYEVFHRVVPLRSNFPLELYIGNNENYATRQFVYPPKITKERELLRYLRIGEMPFMDEEKRKALAFIRTHPGMEVWLTGQRFVAFWTGLANPWESFRSTDSPLVRVLLICNTVAGIGGLLGIVALLWKRSPYAFPLAVYPVVFPCLYYVTHTNLRYRHPIDPVVLLLAAIAGGSLVKKSSTPSGWKIKAHTQDATTPTGRE